MRREFPGICSLFVGLLLLGACAPKPIEGLDDPSAPGPFPIGHETVEIQDPDDVDRVLPAHIWYPAASFDASALTVYTIAEAGILSLERPSELAQEGVAPSREGPFPLILFSHGYGSLGIQSRDLCEHLASHGFAVVAPDHTGNTVADGQNGTEVSYEEAEADRPHDVRVVLDYMAARTADGTDLLSGLLDMERVGVTGHSFGGYTSLAAAGGHPPEPEPDPRVKAIAPISGSSDQLSDAELRAISVPTLFLTGTLDESTPIDPHVTRPMETMTAEPRYRVDVAGATHTHFANICDIGRALIDLGIEPDGWEAIGAGQLLDIYDETCGPEALDIGEASRVQCLYVVAFFRAHLAREADYASYLGPEYSEECEAITEVFPVGELDERRAVCVRAD